MSKEWEAVLIILVSAIAIGMIVSGFIDIWTAALDSGWSLEYDRNARGWMCAAIGAALSYMVMKLTMRIRIEELEKKLHEIKEGQP